MSPRPYDILMPPRCFLSSSTSATATKVVPSIRWRRCGARRDEFEAEDSSENRLRHPALPAAGRTQECVHPPGMDVSGQPALIWR